MRHLGIYLLLAGLSVGTVRAQIGGRHVYDFLNLPVSARQAALGGINVSSQDDDLLMAAQNPAAVNPSMHGRAGLTYTGYLAGIRYGFTAYSRTWDKVGSFYTGIQYLTSGEMQGADELGNLTETFSAGEFAWVTGYSRAWRQFRYGGSLKLISSSLAPGFTSLGIAADLGGSYKSKSELFVAGLVVRNAGLQLTTYTGTGDREPLPFEIVAGVSNKLKYMPLRFSITATNLDQPRLIYRDPDPEPEYDLSGNLIEPKSQFSELIFRHFVFSTEFLLGDFLRLRAGYNHLRRQELRAVNRGGMTGFSLGAGIHAGRLALDYGFSSYGISSAFSTHQVSLGLGLTRPE